MPQTLAIGIKLVEVEVEVEFVTFGFLIFRLLLVDGIVWLLMIKAVPMLGVYKCYFIFLILLLFITKYFKINAYNRAKESFLIDQKLKRVPKGLSVGN